MNRHVYTVLSPPLGLSPWVECIWELQPNGVASWSEVVPVDLHCDLVINLGTPYAVQTPAGSRALQSCLIGARMEPHSYQHHPDNHLVGIRFRPGAAVPFLDSAAPAPLDLHDAAELNLLGRETVERIGNALVETRRSSSERLKGVCDLLQLAVPACANSSSWGQDFLRSIRALGCFRTRELAAELGLSERSLQRKCRSELGVTPKFAARWVRVCAARQMLESGSPAARVAADLDFADQAHLSRELRSLLGKNAALPAICRVSSRPGRLS